MATYDSGEDEMVSGALPDEYGNIYVAATQAWGYRYFIKYDSGGNVQWVKQDNTNVGNRDGDVAFDASGNIFVTGYNWDQFRTTKYDSDAKIIWDRIYNPGRFDYSNDIAVDDSGNVYVSGFSTDNRTYHQAVTLKYDGAGNLLWDRRYDAGTNANAGGVAVDSDGNVYVGAYSVKIVRDPVDIHLLKYDSGGTLIWDIFYDSGDDDACVGVALDLAGNIYATGSSSNGSDFCFRTMKFGFYQPPAERIENIMDDIHILANEIALNKGEVYALTRKLENALKSLDKGNTQAACNQMGAVINQIYALINSDRITLMQAQALIDALQDVIDELSEG